MVAWTFNITNTAFPLIASACFVFGILYASVALHRLDPVWNPHQQLLLASTTLQGSGNKDVLSPTSPCWEKSPPIWPHSLVITQIRVPDSDAKVGPATTITYYDFDQGGNLIQIFPIGGRDTVLWDKTLWDLELNTGHSFYFYPSKKSCRPVEMPVGILRPNWLEGATPLGPSWSTWRRAPRKINHFKGITRNPQTDRLVCGWTKLDFIDYYADAETGEPDSWYFHSMKASFRVLNYTVVPTNTIDPGLFVPPDYCFS